MPARVIIFDTETNGLPLNWKRNGIDEPNNWPDLVSICWKVYDNGRHTYTENHIIRPDGWTINSESTSIHGISHEYAVAVGRPLAEVLEKFKADIKGCTKLVAHNLNFDSNVMQSAYKWRLNEDPSNWWPTGAHFCTMLTATEELKIPNKHGYASYKWPKLDELYTATFNEEAPANAHSADRDVEVLAKIYWKRYDTLVPIVEEPRGWLSYCAIM